MDKLYAANQGGGASPAPGDEKPAVAIAAPFLAIGVNGSKANGIDNLNSKGLFGFEIMATSAEAGGKAILQIDKLWKGNKLQMALSAVPEQVKANGGGGSGSSSGGSSSGGGGGGGGGSSGGGAPSRGGSGDEGLSKAITSLQSSGISFNPEQISAPSQPAVDHTPAPPPPVVQPTQVASVDEGFGRG